MTIEGIENKQRLQTLSINNAWSNKNFLFYLTFRMLQHTSSEVNGYNCYKHFKKSDLQCKIKETLLISELKPSLNENVGSEKLFLY